jgi:hypothetical protein
MLRDHGFDVAAQIGRQAPGFAEQIVELYFKDGGDALNEIVALAKFSSSRSTRLQ